MTQDASILLVDDLVEILEALSMTMEAVGYRVFCAMDGVQALEILEREPVDMILADIAMPRMNGYQLYERVRQRPEWVSIPFIFLTGRAMDSDIRYGKELGVDDYLTKPIEPEDLLAAVAGKLRRAQQLATMDGGRGQSDDGSAFRIGRIKIDLVQHRVWLIETQVRLSVREFDLLAYLARNSERIVPPEELIQATHGMKTDRIEAGSLLRPLIRSLRRNLGYMSGDMGCIENVRGVGYRLVNPDE